MSTQPDNLSNIHRDFLVGLTGVVDAFTRLTALTHPVRHPPLNVRATLVPNLAGETPP